MAPSPTPFQLMDKMVVPERNIIAGPQGEVSIEPKIMQVLCVMASEPGRVFGRSELIDRVWGTEYGADESLTRAISLLRKALGDTRGQPAIIETIAKRGYRLLPSAFAPDAQHRPKADKSPWPSRRILLAAGCATAAAIAVPFWFKSGRSAGIPVIVLPVNAYGPELAHTNIAAPLTVDLVGLLARDKRFHVTVRNADPATRGRRRYAIYADLQMAQRRIRTHVEIMDHDTDQALWSRLYERPYKGDLSTESELATTISRDLTAGLLSLADAPK